MDLFRNYHYCTVLNICSNIVSWCPQYNRLECVTLPAQDAGLENMALEVGTVQGGQIAALQDGKDGALGKAQDAPKKWRL